DALLEDARPLVDERMQQTVEDLLVRDLAPPQTELTRYPLAERGHLRIDDAGAPVVAVEALAAFLAEPAGGHDALEDRRPALIGGELSGFAGQENHILPGQIPHRERPHGEPETLHDPVDLLRRSTFLEQVLCLAPVEHQHAITDET